jgi:ABC-type multidrug transport system ATPase subunit
MVRVAGDSGAAEPDQPAVLHLEVDGAPARVVLAPGEVLLVGRDPACHLVVNDRSVSRRHAEISRVDGAWVIRDLASRNGIHLAGRRTATATVTAGAEIRIGSPHDGPVLRFTAAASAPPPAATPPAAGPRTRPEVASFDASGVTTIGRSAEADIVLTDLLVSRRHAEIQQQGAVHQLVDLGSTNGTYHNGRRINRAILRPGDRISVGHVELVFDGRRLHEHVDTGPVSLSAEAVTVEIGKSRIVDQVSFSLPQGSLLGIIGPSGCGKSTLIRAITGLHPASSGRVRYDGRDLYADYAELRYRIGLVPQDDVLHRQLSVRRALRFAASLRFADDVSRRERSARVDEVLATLGLSGAARQRIDRLSGGQRKRTSVALELLTEPSVLCLDEPTSGLDPALDRDVMRELRGMADRGRTVLCVTHSVLHLDSCQLVLVMCPGGTIGYFGPPAELLAFFEAGDYADVFAKVTREPEHWTRRYRESAHYQRYVAEPLTAEREQPPVPERAGPGPGPGPVARMPDPGRRGVVNQAKDPVGPVREFATLSLRMFAVTAADRGFMLFLLGLPVVLALLSHTVPGETGLGPPNGFSLEAQRLLVVLVVGAAFIGISSAIREIVHESVIYQRERAVGLSPGAYLASKFVVLGVINVIQVSVFVWLSLLGRGGPAEALVLGSPLLEIIVPVAMVTTSCTMLGLCISALARSVAQTTPVLVVVVMAMLVLSGGLFELAGEAVLNQVSWLSPTRWGFAAGASTVDLLSMVPTIQDPLWTHSAGSWWRAILLLALQIGLLTAAARVAMRRLEPGRR